MQPFFLQYLIEALSTTGKQDEALYWAIALAVSQHAISQVHAHIFLNNEILATDVKSGTISLIFKKVSTLTFLYSVLTVLLYYTVLGR